MQHGCASGPRLTHACMYVSCPSPHAAAAACCHALQSTQQVQDDAWHLPYSGADLVATPDVASTAACADLCKANCQFFTYDYVTKTCYTKTWTAPVLEG